MYIDALEILCVNELKNALIIWTILNNFFVFLNLLFYSILFHDVFYSGM